MEPINRRSDRGVDADERASRRMAKTAITSKENLNATRKKGLDAEKQRRKVTARKTAKAKADPGASDKARSVVVDKMLTERERKILAKLEEKRKAEAEEKRRKLKTTAFIALGVVATMVAGVLLWMFVIHDDSPQKCQGLKTTFDKVSKARGDLETGADVMLSRMTNDPVGARYTSSQQGGQLASQLAKSLQQMKNVPKEMPACSSRKNIDQATAVVTNAVTSFKALNDAQNKLTDDYNSFQERILCQEATSSMSKAQGMLRDAMSTMAATLNTVQENPVKWSSDDIKRRVEFETTVTTARNQQSTAATLRTTSTCHTRKEAFSVQANTQNVINQADTLNTLSNKIRSMMSKLNVRDQHDLIDKAAEKYKPRNMKNPFGNTQYEDNSQPTTMPPAP